MYIFFLINIINIFSFAFILYNNFNTKSFAIFVMPFKKIFSAIWIQIVKRTHIQKIFSLKFKALFDSLCI